MSLDRYLVTSTERLVCVLEVEATSKNDAIRRAEAILSGGHYNWESRGVTLRVKKVRKEDDVRRT